MKLYLRAAALLLAALIALSFCACGSGADPASTAANTGDAPEGATEAAETVDTEAAELEAALAAIPEYDFEGKPFNVIARPAVGTSEKEIYSEEENGEVLNDAVFRRNSLVNERFNTEITLITGDASAKIKSAVLSGDNTYDISMPNISEASTLASGGILYNFCALPHNNFERPWWELGTYELNIAGKVFFMNSAMNYLADDVTYIMMFNKQLIADNGMEEPYELVRGGKWTIDVFTKMIQDISADIDGDGEFTTNDLYGFITTSAYQNGFFYASDLKYINSDADTGLHLALDVEKATLLLEKTNYIYHGGNVTWMSPGGQEGVGKDMFMQNGGLFYGEVMSYIVNMRAMDTDFGVIPIPKWDEAQENYKTYVNNISSTMVIPLNCPDPERLSAILEMIAVTSRMYVTPAYYDVALSGKFTRDEESAEMLEIIRRHRVYDFGMTYTTIGLSDLFSSLVLKNSGDIISQYEKRISKAETQIDKLTEKFDAME